MWLSRLSIPIRPLGLGSAALRDFLVDGNSGARDAVTGRSVTAFLRGEKLGIPAKLNAFSEGKPNGIPG